MLRGDVNVAEQAYFLVRGPMLAGQRSLSYRGKRFSGIMCALYQKLIPRCLGKKLLRNAETMRREIQDVPSSLFVQIPTLIYDHE